MQERMIRAITGWRSRIWARGGKDRWKRTCRGKFWGVWEDCRVSGCGDMAETRFWVRMVKMQFFWEVWENLPSILSLTLLGLAFLTYVKGWGGANMPPLLLTIYLKIEYICFRVFYLVAKIEEKKWSSFFPYLKYLVMAATWKFWLFVYNPSFCQFL